jgi:tetratricopeptide (TPR) repeat protein
VTLDEGLAAAHSASESGDYDAALTSWAAVRAAFPGHRAAYLHAAHLAQTLDRFEEADAIIDEAVARGLADPALLVKRAWIAHRRRDYETAVPRWRDVQVYLPNHSIGYTGASASLREAGRFAEARAPLMYALARFPSDIGPVTEYANLARASGDLIDEVQAWQCMRICFPDQSMGYCSASEPLCKLGRFGEATTVIEQGIARFPSDAGLLVEYARVAVREKAWDLAVERWKAVRDRFPGLSSGFYDGALALCESSQFEEADRLLSTAINLFSSDLMIAIRWALLAHNRHTDRPEAIRRWSLVQARFPDEPMPVAYNGQALREAGRLDEADHLLTEGMERFPSNVAVAIEHAYVATHRSNWGEASRRWEAVRQRFPGDDSVRYGYGDFLMLLQSDHIDGNVGGVPDNMTWHAGLTALGQAATGLETTVSSVPDGVPASEYDLAMLFESLGENCEFGLIQRRCGAEPLGLLRWAGTHHQNLMQMLASQFDGVGQRENTFVQLVEGEYVIISTNHFSTHTFIREHMVDQARFIGSACRRLTFLRKKLIEDLQSGLKIFVRKRSTERNDLDEAHNLHRAIRRYGNSTLLYVIASDDTNPPGAVREICDGLLIAYLAYIPLEPQRASKDAWLVVMRKAADAWITARARRLASG